MKTFKVPYKNHRPETEETRVEIIEGSTNSSVRALIENGYTQQMLSSIEKVEQI